MISICSLSCCGEGEFLGVDHDKARPDILILGKSLGGGVYPVSAVLCDDHIMMTIRPGQHGSTHGGNPLGARVAMACLDVIRDERLVDNSRIMGEIFRERITTDIRPDLVETVRGRGLMNAVVITPQTTESGETRGAWEVCLALRDAVSCPFPSFFALSFFFLCWSHVHFSILLPSQGLLAKPTHQNIIRFTPPLVIGARQMQKACDTIEKVLKEF